MGKYTEEARIIIEAGLAWNVQFSPFTWMLVGGLLVGGLSSKDYLHVYAT